MKPIATIVMVRKGAGDGKVAAGVTVDDPEKGSIEKGTYNGVANLTGDALKNISEGHIFHVITHGKGSDVGPWIADQCGRSLEDCQVC